MQHAYTHFTRPLLCFVPLVHLFRLSSRNLGFSFTYILPSRSHTRTHDDCFAHNYTRTCIYQITLFNQHDDSLPDSEALESSCVVIAPNMESGSDLRESSQRSVLHNSPDAPSTWLGFLGSGKGGGTLLTISAPAVR